MVLITAEGGTDNTMGLLQYKIRESNVLADTVVSVNHEVESAIVSKIQDLKRRGKEDCPVQPLECGECGISLVWR